MNIPVGIVAFVLAWRLVPKLATHPHRFDIVGVVLSAVALFLIVFGLQEGEKFDWGVIWGPISVWGLIIVGLIVLGLFILQQAKTRSERWYRSSCSATATSRERTSPSPRSASR